MNYPKQIKLSGHTIKIEFIDVAHSSNKGQYNDYSNLILIEKDFDTPEDNISETFLHEIIEAIIKKNNLIIDHTHLTVLSESLYQVIKDNKLKFY